MSVDKACEVGLYGQNLVVVGYRLARFGPVSDTVACEDPHNKICLEFRVMDSPLDVVA